MKILLYIPQAIDSVDIHHELSSRLAQALGSHATVDLLHDLQGVSAESLKSYTLVHVMGCWADQCASLASRARTLRLPVVCSPLGGLQPWVLKQHHSSRQYSACQQAISGASAVHVCSPLELATFTQLGWNKRMALIKNPVLTSLTTFDEMSAKTLSLYRKVIDSHARMLLTADDRRLIGDLLQLGSDQQVMLNASHIDDLSQRVRQTDDEAWRRIFIYASEELITDTLRLAIQRLQIEVTDVVVEEIERFESTQKYVAGHLSADKLLKSSSSTLSTMNEMFKPEQVKERMLCIALLNLRHEVNHHSAPLRHLADLYTLLRFNDVDEDLVGDVVEALGIDEFAERLMSVMAQLMHLTEGFEPFPEKPGKATDELEQELTKFGRWL